MRREYATRGLRRRELAADPMEQFRAWFDAAVAEDILEPNAMTLSSADQDGEVTSRTVLLKDYDERGFVFYTSYASRKARQMAANPRVALLFAWLPQERQIGITGRVEKVSTAKSLEYFAGRPFSSRIGAWVSEQSQVIGSREVLERKFEEMREKFSEGEVPLPENWGGYRVTPETVEFWQGSASRLHDRFRYRREKAGWRIERLAP